MKPSSNEKSYVQLPIFNGSIPSEVSGDYILPDTYPDVKKILRTDARPVLIGRYISGKRLEFSGGVDYTVIFSADNENGESIHCVHFSGEWNSAAAELDGLDSADISICPKITACTARLSNPRKLSIRSLISSDVTVLAKRSALPKCEGAKTKKEEQRLEKLTESVLLGLKRSFVSDPLRVSENLEPDSSAPAIDEIISCSAGIHFHEARPSLGEGLTVALKGTLAVDCLYKALGESGKYASFSRKIPITHTVYGDEYAAYFEDCDPDSVLAHATATPVEINALTAENSYGERRVVELDVSADVTVQIMGGEETLLTGDMYSTERSCECVFENLDCHAPARVIPFSFSVGESLLRSELSIPENVTVVNAAADVVMPSAAVDKGRCTLSGVAAVSCILCDTEGAFSSFDATLPIRCEINAGDVHEPFSYSVDAIATDMRVRLDSERIYFDFEVPLCMTIAERRRRRVVDTIRLTGDGVKPQRTASMTLCYPANGDTLWEVAKRYGISASAIEAANTQNARVLTIPRQNSGREFTL